MNDEIDNFEDIPNELAKELAENGYQFLRVIPGKGICGLTSMLFTVGLCYGLDFWGREGRYCYDNWREAIVALVSWSGQGDPPGRWIVHKGKGGDIPNPEREQEIYGPKNTDNAN